MSFSRAKTNGLSTMKPSLPKIPTRIPSKRLVPNQEDLEVIVNNLSTIVKRSEELLTPMKSSQTISVRRTSSLHINNPLNLSNSFVKSSNSHHDQLTDSNLDLSRMNSQRRSIRNTEKFSGIKCSLPSTKATMPNTFKGLEKHTTPTKNSSSVIDTQVTPVAKSPWRLRFEKFLNHQELTPLSPVDEPIAFKTAKLDRENRTPSFRLPTRRTSKIHSVSKSRV